MIQDFSFIHWCLEHLNYGTIFLLMTIESSFIPFPSEIVVPPAAYLSAQGKLNAWGVILSSSAGSLMGAIINYYLALFLGRPLVYAFVKSKAGAFFLLNEKKLRKAELYFDKKGAIATFIGRLIPGIRQLISIPAGLSKMSPGVFLLFTFLGAGLWTIVLFSLGWWAQSIPEIDTTEKLVSFVSKYSHVIGSVILAIIVVFLIFYFLRYFNRKKIYLHK